MNKPEIQEEIPKEPPVETEDATLKEEAPTTPQVESEDNKLSEEGTASKQNGDFKGEEKNYRPESRHAPVMTDSQYIEERVDGQIAYFNAKSSWNQKRYKKIKRWEITISSLVPVIVSLSAMGVFQTVQFGKDQNWGLDTILLVIAALGGVVQVIFNKFIDLEEHFKLWKDYRSTCEALQNQRLLYLTRTEPFDEEDAYPLFVEKIESILNNEQQKWKQRQPAQQQKQQQAQESESQPPNLGAIRR